MNYDSGLDLPQKLEAELRLPSGFLQSLPSQDDWSFIIKCHAFIEAAITDLLVTSTGREELREPLSHLELSHPNAGKAAMAGSLGLLDKAERRFIRAFSELRNNLVHDVRMVNFDLPAYVASLDANQFKAFVEAFGYVTGGTDFEHEGEVVRISEIARRNPKIMIHFGVLLLASAVYGARRVGYLKTLIDLMQKHQSEHRRAGPAA